MSTYPHTIAKSTGSENDILLASILAAGTLDELSNAEDFAAVKSYIKNTGRVDGTTNKTTTGLIFWLYPTGLNGPYHEDGEGKTQQHGTLITIERGVDYNEAVAKATESLNLSSVGHVHIAA